MDQCMDRERALLQAALAFTSELSLDAVLQKITDVAKDLVRARYAALGVARADRKGLSQFVVSGVTCSACAVAVVAASWFSIKY